MSTTATSSPELNRKALKQPDAFSQTTQSVFSELAQHKGLWLGIAGVALVLGTGGALYKMSAEKKAAAGRDALYKAQLTLDKGLKAIAEAKAPADAKPAAKADAKDAKKDAAGKDAAKEDKKPAVSVDSIRYDAMDVDAKLPDAVKELEAVTKNHPGTRAAFEARMMVADLYYNHGNAAKAAPLYEKAAAEAPKSLDRALAWAALGYARENEGKYADAIAAFNKSLQQGEGTVKADTLLALGRAHELNKDNAQAKATYDRVISELAGTDAAKSAELLKAALE